MNIHCRVLTLTPRALDGVSSRLDVAAEHAPCGTDTRGGPVIVALWDDPRWCPTCLAEIRGAKVDPFIRRQPILVP